MALIGSLATNSYQGRYVLFNWTATQDVSQNKSTISWSLVGDGGGTEWYKAGAFKVVINGVTVYVTSESDRIQLYDGTIVATGSRTISHKSDGTASFTVSIQAGIYTYAVNCTGSTTFTLDTIPRVSTFSVSKTSVDMGTEVAFSISRKSAAFTHKLTLAWGGKTTNIATNVGTYVAWTPPLTLANDLPSSTSNSCVITCITYNGSTEIGRNTLTMTLRVPTSVKPSISDVVFSEATSGLASKFGAYIQGKSALKTVITASGAYSSTIKSYSTKILNKTYTGGTFTSDVIDAYGTVSVAVTVTDTRGRTATVTKSVMFLEYSDPTITKFTAQRCDSDGTLNDTGEYVKLSIAFNITPISGNDKSYTIGYKLKENTQYTTLTSGSVYSLDSTYISTVTFNGDNSFDFILIVTDYFRTSADPITLAADISTAFTIMDFHSSGTGMAIGKVSEKPNTLEIALNVEFKGGALKAIVDAIYPVGSIYLAFNHANPANLFGGTWVRIENAFLWASTESDTIGKTGGERAHTLTVAEMPTHKHQIAAYKATDGNGVTVDTYSALAGSSTGSDTTGKYYTNGTQSVGGSQPHNNMPPYIQVSAWRREA